MFPIFLIKNVKISSSPSIVVAYNIPTTRIYTFQSIINKKTFSKELNFSILFIFCVLVCLFVCFGFWFFFLQSRPVAILLIISLNSYNLVYWKTLYKCTLSDMPLMEKSLIEYRMVHSHRDCYYCIELCI